MLNKFFLGQIFKELKIHLTAHGFYGLFLKNQDQWGIANSNNVVNLLKSFAERVYTKPDDC